MPNLRMVLEYDGRGFHGWQAQPGVRTVQVELQKVLETITREKELRVIAAGRTDAGVHARGQVAHVSLERECDLGRLQVSISSIFKNELAVRYLDWAEGFHSQFDAVTKQYTYTIYHSRVPPVFDYGKVWHLAKELDIQAMQSEASQLVGTHDFSSFRATGCCARDPVREILESEITFEAPFLRYRVVGRGFLKQMVRNIVGTLVDLNVGKLQCSAISEILEARDRRVAGVTAQPYGLCLDWVQYADFHSGELGGRFAGERES